MHRFRPTAAWLACVCAAALAASGPAAAADARPGVTTDWVRNELAARGTVEVLVRFDASVELRAVAASASADGRAAVVRALRERARGEQAGVRAWLDARGVPYRSLWIVNALAVELDADTLAALAARPEVVRIEGDPRVRGIEAVRADGPSPDATEWGIRAIRADRVWTDDDVVGRGVTVASADTGVEWDHPALRDHYRGWDGASVSHDFHWYDPIEHRAAPIDDHDHGTHTTGTMVGDDGTGNQVGVAPGARWIACRNMDAGVGQPSTYLDCMQFFVAPWPHGGDPDTDGDPAMAPDVINNSWGCPPSEGCEADTLADGVAAVTAAGILFVASAGNSGPFCSTVSDPPAIYDDAFSVGSTESSGGLSLFSSKGPVNVDGSGRLKPDVAAPGGSVRSSVRGGGYASFSGTSMAGPHVAGALALLWEARPGLRGNLALSRCVMARSGTPVSVSFLNQCGGKTQADRPNHLFGWGQIDAWGAIHPVDDADGDGIAGECDCRPNDAGAFATPGESHDLTADADKTTWRWDDQSGSAGAATVHDLARGDLAVLRDTGSTSASECVAGGISGGQHADPQQPAPGDGLYYLVRGRNACGQAGWGAASSGAPRAGGPCP